MEDEKEVGSPQFTNPIGTEEIISSPIGVIANFRITEDGGYRLLEDGNFRIIDEL